jgi:hypothetical protein
VACNEQTTAAPLVANGPTYVVPEWGLTGTIPEGITLAWGARAIYHWGAFKKPVLTPTGKPRKSRGQPVTETIYEPSIDLLWDRQSWSSRFDASADAIAARAVMGTWLNTIGLSALKKALLDERVRGEDNHRVTFVDAGFTITANPNGSCGYLYIAAWRLDYIATWRLGV